MTFYRAVYLSVLILFYGKGFAQTKTFTLKTLGLKVGKLEACHVAKNKIDIYASHSTIEFITLKADVKTESIYQNGILIKATVNSIINGEPYSSKTLWVKDRYVIDCHARNYTYSDTTLTKPIRWSAGKLYFEIPAAGVEVYTESYGKLGTLDEVKKNGLKMTTPESKQIYHYNSTYNELLKIEVINNIKNFDMIPDK